MELFGESIPLLNGIFLLLALLLALTFEFVNGFHDTANAVATVIYTHSLRPTVAVVWSGICNLVGVLLSPGTVAFGVVALLPLDLVLNVGAGAGTATVFAMLISAIIWNLGTWYMGIPASSSHTLVGAILGVGLANSMMAPGHAWGDGVNWTKAYEIGMSLLISPMVGFVSAALLLLLFKLLVKRPELFVPPEKGKAPPFWVRSLLILTCTGVSYAHGSNDGQKGMGLIMLILIGILPFTFAVDMGTTQASINELIAASRAVSVEMVNHPAVTESKSADEELAAFVKTTGQLTGGTFAALGSKCGEVSAVLEGKKSLNELTGVQRRTLRSDLYLASESAGKLLKQAKITDPPAKKAAVDFKKRADKLTKFIPDWVKFTVALALGLGTMIGWKRIVITVGEKIGKEHLTYAQGASAELVAMCTILSADRLGLPVSTTHVLSSGIAGTMAANNSGLQMRTLQSLLLAWVLTLPVCVLLGAGIFAFVLNSLLYFGIK